MTAEVVASSQRGGTASFQPTSDAGKGLSISPAETRRSIVSDRRREQRVPDSTRSFARIRLLTEPFGQATRFHVHRIGILKFIDQQGAIGSRFSCSESSDNPEQDLGPSPPIRQGSASPYQERFPVPRG